jgi:hypothetical protein
MFVYVKLMTGDLIQLDILPYSSPSDISNALHNVDPKKYPKEYIRILKENNEEFFTENEIIPVFIDIEPLFKVYSVYVYDLEKMSFKLEIEFDLKNSIDVISYNDQDPRRDPRHFEKNELTDEEWNAFFSRIKKEFHRNDKQVQKSILRIEKNDENYEVSVRPFCFNNFAYTLRKRILKDIQDIHKLSTIELGIFLQYDMVKVLGENELLYKLLSFRFKENVAEGIIELFEKIKINIIERPYMYSIDIYTHLLRENSGISYIDSYLYKEVLCKIDPKTVLDIELECQEEDYDDEGPRHVEKYWAILIKEVDGVYKIKWHNSYLSRCSYEVNGKETVLSTQDFDPEIHTGEYLDNEIKKDLDCVYGVSKDVRNYLLKSEDLKLKYGYVLYMKK